MSLCWSLAGILVVAVALRLLTMMGSSVLANDEAALAWNIEIRGFTGLLHPLEFSQGAPIGFLMLAKGVYGLLGSSPAAYRTLPFLFGMGAVLGVGLLARKVVPPWVAIGAMALAATSGAMVQYSAFFKQYAVDSATCVALLLAMAAWADVRQPTHASAVQWRFVAVTALLAPWFSHASAFVIAGAGGVVLAALLARGRRDEAGKFALILAAALLSFAVHYLAFARHLNDSTFLREFWRAQMMPDPVTSLGVAKWLTRSALEPGAILIGSSVETTGGRAAGVAAFVLAAIGAHGVWRRHGALALMLIAPAALALVAAGARMYPFSGRLLLFTMPPIIVLAAAGVAVLVRREKAAGASLIIAAAAMAAVWFHPARGQGERERLDQTCRELAPEVGPRDHVYVFYPNRVVCFYALVHAGVAPAQVTSGAGDSPGPFEAVHNLKKELDTLPTGEWDRAWVVLTLPRELDGRDEGDVVAAYFRTKCTNETVRTVGATRVFSFACRAPASLPAATALTDKP